MHPPVRAPRQLCAARAAPQPPESSSTCGGRRRSSPAARRAGEALEGLGSVDVFLLRQERDRRARPRGSVPASAGAPLRCSRRSPRRVAHAAPRRAVRSGSSRHRRRVRGPRRHPPRQRPKALRFARGSSCGRSLPMATANRFCTAPWGREEALREGCRMRSPRSPSTWRRPRGGAAGSGSPSSKAQTGTSSKSAPESLSTRSPRKAACSSAACAAVRAPIRRVLTRPATGGLVNRRTVFRPAGTCGVGCDRHEGILPPPGRSASAEATPSASATALRRRGVPAQARQIPLQDDAGDEPRRQGDDRNDPAQAAWRPTELLLQRAAQLVEVDGEALARTRRDLRDPWLTAPPPSSSSATAEPPSSPPRRACHQAAWSRKRRSSIAVGASIRRARATRRMANSTVPRTKRPKTMPTAPQRGNQSASISIRK